MLHGLPYDTAERVIPVHTSAVACAPMASASKGILNYACIQMLARQQPQWCTTSGRFENTELDKALR